jgi:cytochrome c oxidase assembly factor 2
MMPDGTRRRRKRRKCVEKEGQESLTDGSLVEESSDDEGTLGSIERLKRGECPIPKPGGIVGEILGFRESSSSSKGGKPP